MIGARARVWAGSSWPVKVARTGPLRASSPRRCRSARSPSSSGTGRGSTPPPTATAARPSSSARRGRWPTLCAPRVSSASVAPTSRGTSTWTTSTRRWSCWPSWRRRASTAGARDDWRSRRAGRPGITGRPGRRRGAAAARPAPQPSSATPAPSATTTTSHRLLRALPRRVADLQLRGLLARGGVARRGPGDQARAGLHEARAAHRANACSTSAAAGAASRSTPPPATVSRSSGITLSPPQAELARRRVAEAGLADQVEIRVADYRELADEPFDAIASIGMVEHVGADQIDHYAHQLARCCAPAGGCSTTGSPALRHGDPEAGPFSERYVFPDAAPLHLSRIMLGAGGRGNRRPTTSRALPTTTPRRSATGPAASTRISTRPGASPATSARGSGVSTCAPRATAS